MRVLSLQQPFAQLVVRGVKRIEVRSWTTDFTGRIAIHAAKAVPSFEMQAEWWSDRTMGRRFADQGWKDREDLKALPRSAIVGTVELVGTTTSEEVNAKTSPLFTWNWLTDLMELATRDTATGQMRPLRTRLRPLPVSLLPNSYVFAFMKPVEIEPIGKVTGKLNLWNLPKDLSLAVHEREARSLAGEWDPAPIEPAERAAALKAWRERWHSEAENTVRTIEEAVRRDREIDSLIFDDPDTEERFSETILKYVNEYGHYTAADEQRIRLDRRLQPFFDGRSIVPVDEFELVVRRYIFQESNRQKAQRRDRDRREYLVAMLMRLRALPKRESGGAEGIHKKIVDEVERLLDAEEDGEEVDYPEQVEPVVQGEDVIEMREIDELEELE